MNEAVLAFTGQVAIGIAAGIALLVVLAGSWYDLTSVTQNKLIASAKKKMRISNQPSILILIYAHNDGPTVITCLRSIKKNRYANYLVLVCDNASSDSTVQALREFKRRNNKMLLSVYASKSSLTRSKLLQIGYKKVKSHDFVLIIDASDSIQPSLLAYSAAYFSLYNDLAALHLRSYVPSSASIETLSRTFVNMSINIIHKAASRFSVSSDPFQYRSVVLRESSLHDFYNSRRHNSIYASSLLTTSSASVNASSAGTLHLLTSTLGSVCGIALMSYFFYSAATLQSSIPLLFSWLLVSLWLLAVIWSDDTLHLSKRFELMTTVPFMYFILYAQLFLTVIKNTWLLLTSINPPAIPIATMRCAIVEEAYSTRF